MNDYNEQLEFLFKEWKTEASKSGVKCDNFFVKDGIMYKTTPVGVQAQWEQSPLRIAFLMKDQPQSNDPNGCFWDDDARNWLRDRTDVQELKKLVFRRLAYILWGICNTKTSADRNFDSINHSDLVRLFDTIPFAYIETKKQPGGGSLDEKAEQAYLDRFNSYLQKELDILNPNVFVCFSQRVYHWLTHSFTSELSGLKKISGNVYYHPEKDIVILYILHPSTTVYGPKYDKYNVDDNMYYEVFAMKEYRHFIDTPYGQDFLSKLQLSTND